MILGGFGLLLALTVVAARYQQYSTPPDDEWFQLCVIEEEGPVLVKFGAEWCGPCRQMHHSLAEIKSRRLSGLKIVEVDIDKKPELARHYSISSIPRTMLFVNGKYTSAQQGSMSADEIEAWVRPYL